MYQLLEPEETFTCSKCGSKFLTDIAYSYHTVFVCNDDKKPSSDSDDVKQSSNSAGVKQEQSSNSDDVKQSSDSVGVTQFSSSDDQKQFLGSDNVAQSSGMYLKIRYYIFEAYWV